MLVLVERRLNHLEATPATNHSIKETSYG
jgi:hypothetical protein